MVINKQVAMVATLVAAGLGVASNTAHAASINDIQNIVFIYAENRGFDNLYNRYPGANGLQTVRPSEARQVDRDGSILPGLPPVWGGLTAAGVTPAVTQSMTEGLPNKPFPVDTTNGFNTKLNVTTRDLYHRFYENQMQIDSGKNDMFAAWADSGGLTMGYYDGSKLPLWNVARQNVLADNFFQSAFGGSFLNHQFLICACAPYYPNASTAVAKPSISVVNADGVSLTTAASSPASALNGPPVYIKSGNLTPDFYTINTMQPPYQPSGNGPAPGQDPAYANPNAATTLPPQNATTIGDLMSDKGVTWAWYAGAWNVALAGNNASPVPNFQYHHQPFNYYAAYAPGTAARAAHLLDGGMNGANFTATIDAGALPQVAFYKPQGNLNEHAGYTDVYEGDQHIADIVKHLQQGPQWAHMIVVITYDENGGWWDHVAPPRGDRWGPGTRIPAIIISPFAKRGTVDHTQYDTTSIDRLIIRRFGLANLPGLAARDQALAANHAPPMGDLTNALRLER